jgi:16S rRNA (guanine527-N7)-methyltransferase
VAPLCRRYGLGEEAADRFVRLLEALAHEPDPATAVATPREAADTHIADSLAGLEVEELRSASTIVDVGAGAGFPGLPLAIALPHARVDLIESTARKCTTIERLATAAGVANARAVTARAEDWGRDAGAAAYQAVTARAVAPLAVLCEYAAPLLQPEGVLVCWKGARREDEERAGEAAAAQLGLRRRAVLSVVPFPGAHSRHLHVFAKVAHTPSRFPRRAGMAAKRPLAR